MWLDRATTNPKLVLGRRLGVGKVISRGRWAHPWSTPSRLTIRRVEPAGSTRPVFVNGVYLTSSTPPRGLHLRGVQYARLVDLAADWDNSSVVSARDQRYGFHPNEIGMQCIADNFAAAITSD